MPSTSTAPASHPAPVGRGTLLTSTGVASEHSTALTTGELGAGSTTGTVPSGSRPVGPTRPARSVGWPSSGSRVSTPAAAQPFSGSNTAPRAMIGPMQLAVVGVSARLSAKIEFATVGRVAGSGLLFTKPPPTKPDPLRPSLRATVV